MSGNFVQRGEPALINKWARAEMALSCGADIVLELPVLYATRSAYWFARGGVETLRATGLITHLAFGVETKEPAKLFPAAALLARETPSFRHNLKAQLKKGSSYPSARAHALSLEFGRAAELWSKPNNVLGLTYLQVLQEINAPLIPLLIERKGADYHEPQITPGVSASAAACRQSLLHAYGSPLDALTGLKGFLPETVVRILRREFSGGRGPISLASLSEPLMILLRRTSVKELMELVDITEGLEQRIAKLAIQTARPEDFLARLKTKRYPYSRLQRFLIHLLLGYTKDKEALLTGGPAYLRVLGFTAAGRRLLKEMKKTSSLPIITKGAHAQKYAHTDPGITGFWDMDVLATDLYCLLYPAAAYRKGGEDYRVSPVYIP